MTMPGNPPTVRAARSAIRDALDALAHAFRLAAIDIDGLDAPVILLPIEAWIALQNAATFEFGQRLRADERIGRADEFRYAGFIFRVDRP